MTWIEVGSGLFNIASSDEALHRDPSKPISGVVLKAYVEDVDKHFVHAKAEGARIVSDLEMSSGAGAFIGPWTLRATNGRSRSVAGIWRRSYASCPRV
jgi:hypothetical protein